MTNYTPDTATVRNAYTRALRQAFIASAGEHDEEFDRWLRQVRSDAWTAAVYHLEAEIGSKIKRLAMSDNPYQRGTND